MDKKKLGNRVKKLRTLKGFSQELLADETNLNLRTIQRIESGSTIPRGDTLSRLGKALQVSPDELIDWTKQPDKGYLLLMNISALSFIINPLLGVIIPLALWVSKKDKIEYVEEYGKKILNFQISLIIIFSVIILLLVATLVSIKLLFESDSLIIEWFGPFIMLYIPVGVYYLYNTIMIIINTIRIQRELSLKYKPTIKIVR